MGFISDLLKPSATSRGTSAAAATSAPAEPTAEQLELQQQAVSLGGFQLENIFDTSRFQRDLAALLEQDPSRVQVAGEAGAFGALEAQPELLKSELERIRTGAAPTEEQRELIGRIAEERISAGQSDIEAAFRRNIDVLRGELAPSLGLRPGDTPIIDRGGRLAAEGLRLSEKLVSGARGEEARQLLDFPLRAGALASTQTQAQQDLSLALQEFQNRLQNEAFQRRLGTGALGLNLATISPSGVGFDVGQVSTSTSASKNIQRGKGSAATAAEQFVGGFGQGLGSAIGGSSRKIKENNEPVNYQDILNQFEKFDVELWNYIGRDEQFIGPYAEDMQELFGVGNDEEISFINMNGILMAAVKALLERVTGLEQANG